MTASLSAVARHLNFVRETGGPNRGAWVSMFQRFSGGQDGEAWCSDFVSFVEDIAYWGRSPLRRTGSSDAKLNDARYKGFIVAAPKVDDLYFFITDAGHAHHVGIVTAVSPLAGIAGNTSPDGTSPEGTGVFEHALTVDPKHVVFVRLPLA
jgi:hypothetical protein